MAVTASFSPSTGVLTITGDAVGNTITVSRNAAGTILVNGGAVPVSGGTPTVANTTDIQVFGQDGADVLSFNEANGALPPGFLFGGAGNDTATGGSGADELFGQAGDDTLLGKGGNDFLFGGDGNDVLTGGTGDDQVFGEAGNDRMIWNPGDGTDLFEGGDGVDTAEVNGGNGAETFTITANGSRVRFDRISPAPFSLDIGTTESLVVNMNGGDDVITAGNGLAALISLIIDGGTGNDTITGGDGNDVLLGGDGNDAVTGGRGDDVALLGAGNDVFVWNPGDGNDTVEGQAGVDTLQFNGANVNETINISANGGRVLFTRDVASIVQDLNGVETINFRALGGADTVRVHDLTGTGASQVNLDLAASGGGGNSTADQVVVDGTAGGNSVTVTSVGGIISVNGLPAVVTIANADAGLDALVIAGLDGNDTIDASALPVGAIKLTIDGGAGNDVITGSPSADVVQGGLGNDRVIDRDAVNFDVYDGGDGIDTIDYSQITFASGIVTINLATGQTVVNGGNTETIANFENVAGSQGGETIIGSAAANVLDGGGGDDTIIGGAGDDLLLGGDGNDSVAGGIGNDVALLGLGDDVFTWNPGDGSDTVEGQAGADRLVFNGANVNEKIDLSANGTRLRFTRDVATVTLDVNGVETVDFNALGGSDTVQVHDLAATHVTQVDVDLGASGGGGDGQTDLVSVDGNAAANVVTITAVAGVVNVDGLAESLDIANAEGTLDSLSFNGFDGDDVITAGIGLATLISLTIDGGAGNDTIIGGDGGDRLIGGDGNDSVTGGRGDDVAFLGDGDDVFIWNPGDGNDIVEGQAGNDTLQFNGANVSETIEIAANGGRVRFTRDVANVTQDVNSVETINFRALGGLDTVRVHDLAGTNVGQVNLDLSALGGGGDTQADRVFIDGTASADSVTVAAAGAVARVSGLAATLDIASADEGVDTLTINALGGNDQVTVDDLSGIGLTLVNVDLGSGGVADGQADQVVVEGTAGADNVTVTAVGSTVSVGGLAATVGVINADPALDMLTVEGRDGDDVITAGNGLAALVSLTIDGGNGNDTIVGGDGGDILLGGAGNDGVTGGRGNDVAFLGSGNDVFTWNPGDGSDLVEGRTGADTLQFNGANIAEKIDISANGPRSRFTRDIGNVIEDINSVETIDFRALGGADTVRVHDLTGTDVDDVDVDLGAGGGGGDAEVDQVIVEGTAGRNTITVVSLGGLIDVNGLRASLAISNADAGLDILGISGLDGNDTIDATALTAGAVRLLIDGGAGNDVITGSPAADAVLGGAGNDRIIDQDFVNSDAYDGGDGVDTIDYSLVAFADGMVTIDLSAGQTVVAGGNTETIANFENVVGSQGGETIVGSAAANVLDGAGGNDTLEGGDGNDTLNGGNGDDVLDGQAGADRLSGGAGNDTYFVDNASDTVFEAAGGGSDTVVASVDYALQAGQEVEFLRADPGVLGLTLTGNGFVNTLVGSAGDDALDGGPGADTMMGGAGNDRYVVDNAGDVITENSAGDGVDTAFASVTFTLAQFVDNLTLTGSAGLNGTGNGDANTIAGNAGANRLAGLDGDDILKGGAGDDDLTGGTGNDRLDGSDGKDRLKGGAGADRLTGGLNADTFVFLGPGQSTVDAAGRDAILDFSQAEADLIDLSGMDANTTLAGDQAFTFIASAAFSHTAGELRTEVMNGNTLVSGDINGNGVADFSILVKGVTSIVGTDFVV